MASYLVMTPPGGVHEPDSIRVIRDGFSWFALLMPLIWMMVHRMWFYAILLVAVQLLLVFGGQYLGHPGAGSALLVALNAWLALESGMIRERHLLARGWVTRAALTAGDIDDAEALYFYGQTVPAVPAAAVARPSGNPWAGASLGPFDSYKGV